jgi:hypothetical protein
MLALDKRSVHAELRRPDRRDITARPAADYNEIEILRHPAFSAESAANLQQIGPSGHSMRTAENITGLAQH